MKKTTKETTQGSGVAVGEIYDYPRDKKGIKVSMLDNLLTDTSYPSKKKSKKKK